MHSLQRYFQNVFRESEFYRGGTSSFALATPAELEAHLEVDRYLDFQLTDAVRPAIDLKILPSQGYRHEVYRDPNGDSSMPVLMASASRDVLIPLFVQLVEQLGPCVDVVLESSHDHQSAGHVDFYREQIETPILVSTIWDFEDLLLHDGCTGIAVLNSKIPQEVQFDEHKLLVVYGANLAPYEQVFEQYGVWCNEQMRFVTEAEHVHSSTEHYRQRFDELRMRLGIDCNDDSHYAV
jgi:hypothetical protein